MARVALDSVRRAAQQVKESAALLQATRQISIDLAELGRAQNAINTSLASRLTSIDENQAAETTQMGVISQNLKTLGDQKAAIAQNLIRVGNQCLTTARFLAAIARNMPGFGAP